MEQFLNLIVTSKCSNYDHAGFKFKSWSVALLLRIMQIRSMSYYVTQIIMIKKIKFLKLYIIDVNRS